MATRTKTKTEGGRATVDLWPAAGRILGLPRGSTYQAAARGDIPTIRIGRRILVSKAALERLLQGEQVGAR